MVMVLDRGFVVLWQLINAFPTTLNDFEHSLSSKLSF